LSNRKSSILILLMGVLIAGTLVGLTWVNYRFSEENPGGNDFLARWMGVRAWLQEGISPYDPQVSLATQKAIYGRPANKEAGEDIGHFVYPFTAMVFFAPFGVFEYPLARALWMTTVEMSLFALALLSIRLVRWPVSTGKAMLLVIFSILWYHGMRCIMLGQFAALEALLIVLALYSIYRKRDFSAGIYFALATTKPQMAYLLLIYVLIWAISMRRLEIIWGFLSAMGLMLATSLLFFPDWPLQMLRQLIEYPTYTETVSPLSILAGWLPGIERQMNLFMHTTFIMYLLVEWVLAFRKEVRWFLWTALLTLVITSLVSFRTATTNFVVLLPVLFLIFKNMEDRWRQAGKIAVWFFMAVWLVGAWWLFVMTVAGNQESELMYLPLPFFSLFGLWWMRWWHVKPPRVLLDKLEVR
jgi:hypothetical protein